MIRLMTLEDVPHLPSLHAEGRQTALQRRQATIALTHLYPRLYFGHPWRDERIGPLVSVGDDGRLNGAMGVVSRPLLFRDRRVTLAVCSELYVEPRSRSKLVGIQLLRTFLRGPQDLSL
ncbi:MAG: hypothetical protein GXP27_03295, partial [Planctomycetes bacterium]|nr:hypothetical protein [Planctomycetota bacterium]